MNKIILIILISVAVNACKNNDNQMNRIPVAKAGNEILYFDEIPALVTEGITPGDSAAAIQNYINKWAKRELMFQQAKANLTAELRNDIEKQLEETRLNLIVYEYQRMMMLEKMDTIISREELENYFNVNQNNFILTSNIVKALFIRLPVETPDLNRIRLLVRSNKQNDFQELESLCFQFAEKFDDFNEEWITMDRLSLELKEDISNQETFLRRTSYYETSDSTSVCLVVINDYRLRGTIPPFEYVRDDIKRIIWNSRRIGFIQELENGIYNEALKQNGFKIY
jgi:hypothetical protein